MKIKYILPMIGIVCAFLSGYNTALLINTNKIRAGQADVLRMQNKAQAQLKEINMLQDAVLSQAIEAAEVRIIVVGAGEELEEI